MHVNYVSGCFLFDSKRWFQSYKDPLHKGICNENSYRLMFLYQEFLFIIYIKRQSPCFKGVTGIYINIKFLFIDENS